MQHLLFVDKNGPQKLNGIDLKGYTILQPEKKLDLSALIKAKKYKSKARQLLWQHVRGYKKWSWAHYMNWGVHTKFQW